MIRLLRWMGLVVLVLVLLIVGLVFGARFADGPVGMLPGGPLRSGELVASPVPDWSFAADVEEIELQLQEQSTSRTTWILVHEGAAYIPCSLGFPPGKSWYRVADRDGRAWVRIEGRRYPVTLDRVSDPELRSELESVAREKYELLPTTDAGVWFFRLTSRS